MTPDQTAATPKPERRKKPDAPIQTAKAVTTTPNRPKPPEQRPYLLDSSVVEDDLRRKRDNALSEIEAIDADCLGIETRANNDINSIQARRDTEVSARRHRAEDLRKIVAMADRALTPPLSVTEMAQAAIEQDMVNRRAAQSEGNDQ